MTHSHTTRGTSHYLSIGWCKQHIAWKSCIKKIIIHKIKFMLLCSGQDNTSLRNFHPNKASITSCLLYVMLTNWSAILTHPERVWGTQKQTYVVMNHPHVTNLFACYKVILHKCELHLLPSGYILYVSVI